MFHIFVTNVNFSKLLKMSHKNVDNVDVSTVSEVSTPNQSIVDVASNKPLGQLQNIIKYLNANRTEIESMLNYTPDGSVPYQTDENLTCSSSHQTNATTSSRSHENHSQSAQSGDSSSSRQPKVRSTMYTF